jgi:hypothetical protein
MKTICGILPACSLLLTTLFSLPVAAGAQAGPAPAILHAAEAARVLPDSVFFRGKSASTQTRNAAGIRFSDGMYVLATLVDTSGYSTGIQEKYQGYLLTEVPLRFGTHTLVPGAYGVGFTGNDFHIMDIGDHELLLAGAARDAQMQRPIPLQIQDGASGGLYRLCFGRECVDFRPAE